MVATTFQPSRRTGGPPPAKAGRTTRDEYGARQQMLSKAWSLVFSWRSPSTPEASQHDHSLPDGAVAALATTIKAVLHGFEGLAH